MIHLDLSTYTAPESESYFIEYWYNRHTRDWVIQVFDNNEIQQESIYCPDKAIRDNELKFLASKYDTTDIRKV